MIYKVPKDKFGLVDREEVCRDIANMFGVKNDDVLHATAHLPGMRQPVTVWYALQDLVESLLDHKPE